MFLKRPSLQPLLGISSLSSPAHCYSSSIRWCSRRISIGPATTATQQQHASRYPHPHLRTRSQHRFSTTTKTSTFASVSGMAANGASANAASASTAASAAASVGADADTHIEARLRADGEGEVRVRKDRGDGAGMQTVNAWATPGSAAWDFRSDTATTPNAAMLAAITATTLLDDVLHEDPTTNDLEDVVAALLPTRPATSSPSGDAAATAASQHAGLLVLSGSMGNQVALRSHLAAPPHSVVGDARSHIFQHEAGALCMTSQAYPLPVTPSNGRHLTLTDVQRACVLDDDVHHAPTRLISLENTLNGGILPLKDLGEISDWAHAHDIAVHLDGARLWDAVVALCARGDFGGDLRAGLRAYASLVNSVTVCFSKGLGAPVGSMLVGSTRFIKRARHVRKMLGGGTRMAGLFAAPARVAVDDTFFGGKMGRAHALARQLAQGWTEHGGKLVQAPETGMLWLDLGKSGVSAASLRTEAEQRGVKGYWSGDVVRIVCHYQIANEAVQSLLETFAVVLKQRTVTVQNGNADTADDGGASQALAAVGAGFDYGVGKEL